MGDKLFYPLFYRGYGCLNVFNPGKIADVVAQKGFLRKKLFTLPVAGRLRDIYSVGYKHFDTKPGTHRGAVVAFHYQSLTDERENYVNWSTQRAVAE
ncbi:MAG: hypothetical protein E7H57_13170 [Pantoea sp.]|nr:hypothetical protein [Pantoea sp.]